MGGGGEREVTLILVMAILGLHVDLNQLQAEATP